MSRFPGPRSLRWGASWAWAVLAASAAGAAGCSFESPAGGDASTPDEQQPSTERATGGLVAYWRFDETSGDRANDARMTFIREPALPPMALAVGDPARVAWNGGGLTLSSPVRVGTPMAPVPAGFRSHVNHDVRASGAVTLEVWASPSQESQGVSSYALVFSISPSYAYHSALIAQVGDHWQGQLLTAATNSNGQPAIETPSGTIIDTRPVHLVLVASDTERALYVNGRPYRADTGVGSLRGLWPDYYPISIGQEQNAPTEPRTWLGTLWLAAIYDRALTEAEIRQNLNAGHDCSSC